ncbi:MAG: low molecular weight phosphatase family protein [Patescibacteria group bacterium]
MKILFICRGNVGRSQMAEMLFNDKTKGVHISTSAGTRVLAKDGVTSRHGQLLKDLPGASKVVDVMSEIGLDAGDNARIQLTPEMLDEYDKVIYMSEPHATPDYLSNRDKVIYWEVEDPKEMSVDDTRKIRDQLDGLVKQLIEDLG